MWRQIRWQINFVRSAVWACRCWFARSNHTEVMQRNNVRLLFSLIWLDRVLKSTLVSSLWRRFLTNFIKLGDDESLRSCFVLTRAQNKWILLHSWSVKSFSFPILNSYAKTQLRSQTSSYVILFLFVFTAKRLLINLLTCGLTLLRSRGEGIKNRLDLVKV